MNKDPQISDYKTYEEGYIYLLIDKVQEACKKSGYPAPPYHAHGFHYIKEKKLYWWNPLDKAPQEIKIPAGLFMIEAFKREEVLQLTLISSLLTHQHKPYRDWAKDQLGVENED